MNMIAHKPRSLPLAVALIAIAQHCSHALAYDTVTHAAMTAKAFEKSALNPQSQSSLLTHLGLINYIAPANARYIDLSASNVARYPQNMDQRGLLELRTFSGLTAPKPFSAGEWLIRGVIREDDNPIETPDSDEPGGSFTRVFGHFFDPINGNGLTLPIVGAVGVPAPDWALIPGSTIPQKTFLGAVLNPRAGQNHFKVGDAREAMWRAITLQQLAPNLASTSPLQVGDGSNAANEDERRAYWATTFRALGDVVHLLQDMAQPQHTRNDRHSGAGCLGTGNPRPFCLGGHDGFIEKYLRARTLRLNTFTLDESLLAPAAEGVVRKIIPTQLEYDSYDKPAFATYREYFAPPGAANTTGKGLANYSNRGFYSAGTTVGCRLCTTYPEPSPSGAGLTSVFITSSGSNGEYLRNMAGTLINGQLELLTGTVRDTVTGINEPNVRLTSKGVWDQFLGDRNFLSSYTLNYYNFDEQARLLIPRAVGYSAGLLDFFFRGRLEIAPPAEGIYSIVDHYDFSGAGKAATSVSGFKGFKRIKLKLRNATPDIVPSGGGPSVSQVMSGGYLMAVLKFYRNTAYTDDLSGEITTLAQYSQNRSANEEIISSSRVLSGDIALSQPVTLTDTLQELTFEFTQELPINATDVKLQVVYRGALGSETDAVVVETVDISEPTHVVYFNSTDYIRVNGNFYTRDALNSAMTSDSALRSAIQPQSCVNLTTGALIDTCFQPRTLNFQLRYGGNSAAIGQISLPAATFHRFSVLAPAGVNWSLDFSASSCIPRGIEPETPFKAQTTYELNPNGTYSFFGEVVSGLETLRGIRGMPIHACVETGDGSLAPVVFSPAQRQTLTTLSPADSTPRPFVVTF